MTTDFKSKCRTCLSESSTYYHDFDNLKESIKIADMLDSLVPQIKIKTASQFSTLMCQLCLEKLLSCYKFQQLCLETNDRLNILHGISVLRTHRSLERMFDPLDTQPKVVKAEVGEYAFLITEIPQEELDEEDRLDDERFPQEECVSGEDLSILPDFPFQCFHCSKSFETQDSFSAHYRLHKKGTGTVEFEENSDENFIHHLFDEVTAENIYSIDNNLGADEKCNKNGLPDLREHFEVKQLKCNYCGEVFILHDSLVKHVAKFQTRKVRCRICREEFESVYKLRKHMHLHNPYIGQNKKRHTDTPSDQYESFSCESDTINSNIKTQDFELQLPNVGNEPELSSKEPKTRSNSVLDNFSENILYTSLPIANSDNAGQEILNKSEAESIEILGPNLNGVEKGIKKTVEYNCEICGRIYDRCSGLKRHKNTMHSSKRKFECEICTLRFANERTFLIHFHRHNIALKCEVCEQNFIAKAQLSRHIKNKHPEIEEYCCNICLRKFILRQSFLKHMSIHSSDRRECHICKEVCQGDYKLAEHMRIHNPYVCPHCDRTICGESNFQAHMQSHKEKYPCEVCGKVFNHPGMLQQHGAMHSFARPYECEICKYRFKNVKQLRAHLLWHERETKETVGSQSPAEG